MTDPHRVNRLAATAIRRHAADAAEADLFLAMCGLVGPGGSLAPDDTRNYDLREIEAK